MEKNEITVPENIQQICRDFAEVAKKHGLRKFSGNFSPGFDMEWGGDVSFAWEWGRHGIDWGVDWYLSLTINQRIKDSFLNPERWTGRNF